MGAREHLSIWRRPNLVTIFGQSGGARKVETLLTMPAAKGLFHRAIVESGRRSHWSITMSPCTTRNNS